MLCLPFLGYTQWVISTADQVFTIDFDNTVSGVNNGEFSGAGFGSTPTAGQLDSDAWAVTGLSDGEIAFGDDNTTGDAAGGGQTPFGVGSFNNTTIYAFEVPSGSGNYTFGWQAENLDMTPGDITLRIQNTTGTTMTSCALGYTLMQYDDRWRNIEIDLQYSSDSTTYTEATDVSWQSGRGNPSQGDTGGGIGLSRIFTSVTSLSVANNDYFYLRFDTRALETNNGYRDEVAIDDIQFIANPSTATLDLAPTAASYLEIIIDGPAVSASPGQNIEVTRQGVFPVAASYLTNNGTIILNADATDYSQLKVDETISGSGTVNFEQYVTSAGWHNMALPVSGNLDEFGTVNTASSPATRNVYTWTESANEWTDVAGATDGSSTAAVTGTGYMVYVGANGVASAASIVDATGAMVNTATPSLAKSDFDSGDDDNWNFIGNPFTCNLDFFTLSEADVPNGYSIWNPSTSTYVATSALSADVQGIPPFQGFWVEATGGSPSLGTMTMEDHGSVNLDNAFTKTQTSIADRFVLEVYESAVPLVRDAFLVGFISGMSDGQDPQYDISKRLNAANRPSLMSVSGGKSLAINAIDYSPNNIRTKKLQMRFVGVQDAAYFIELDETLLMNNYIIELEDLKLGKKQKLGTNAIKFIHDDNAEYRFVLHISTVSTTNQGHSTAQISSGFGYGVSGGILVLKLDENENDVPCRLFNLNGQLIREFIFPAGSTQYELQTEDLASGIYILELNTNEGVEKHKIIRP